MLVEEYFVEATILLYLNGLARQSISGKYEKKKQGLLCCITRNLMECTISAGDLNMSDIDLSYSILQCFHKGNKDMSVTKSISKYGRYLMNSKYSVAE